MRLPAAGKVQNSLLLAVVEEEVERPHIAHLTCALIYPFHVQCLYSSGAAMPTPSCRNALQVTVCRSCIHEYCTGRLRELNDQALGISREQSE